MTRAVQISNQLIKQLNNIDYLIFQKQQSGIETKIINLSHRNKKIKHFYSVNPIDKLLSNQTITKEQHAAGRKYQIDFELANKSNHARMSYNAVLGSNTKIIVVDPKEEELRASRNIRFIKEILEDKEEKAKKIAMILKKRYRPKNYLKILELLIEKEIALSLVASGIGLSRFNFKKISSRVCEILDVLENYYNN